jgi:hypothetical protein
MSLDEQFSRSVDKAHKAEVADKAVKLAIDWGSLARGGTAPSDVDLHHIPFHSLKRTTTQNWLDPTEE